MKLTKTRFALALAALVVVVPSIAVAISPFVDVVPGKFYEGPVNWAADNGITTGKDDTHFAPNDGVTRGESVTFLKRYDDNITQPAISSVDQRVTDLGQTIGGLSCGTTQVGYYDGTSWVCGNVSLTSTLTPGATTTLDSTGNVGWDTSVAIGADSNPIISYYDNTGFNLKAFHCADTSCTTGTSNTLDAGTTGNNGEFTAIAIGTDGFPIISYHYGAQADLKAYHCTDTACATGTATTLDTGGPGGTVGLYTSIAIGTDGFAIISYYHATDGDLRAYHCTNTACTTGTATTLDTGGAPGSTVGRYTSIAIGTDGFAIISYQDATNGDLKAYHCTNTACTTGTATTLDTGGPGGSVGRHTSLAIGIDGFPAISYHDSVNGDLKAYHCTNTACTTGTATTLDTGGVPGSTVGRYTSIAIGTDNNPVIGYQDLTNTDLKAYHCTNRACTAGRSTTIDSSGNVGLYTSIAIGTDGLPVISYYENFIGDLKVTVVDVRITGVKFG